MIRALGILALTALAGGCATVTRGLTEQVQIVSEPPGAEARTSMGHVCTTPCTLQFNRKDEFSVTVSAPGYEPQTVPVQTRLAGAGAAGFAGNVILGGVIGMGVDAASGATLEHFPNPVQVELQRVKPPPPPPALPPRQRRKSAPPTS